MNLPIKGFESEFTHFHLVQHQFAAKAIKEARQ